MTKEATLAPLLSEVERVFAMPRPGWFVNANHCCECAEHEETLQAHNVETLGLESVGSPAWDPVCFISNADGFKYFLPALARLACGAGQDYYLSQFLFHLNGERVATFTKDQRRAVENLLWALSETLARDIEDADDYHDLEWALRRLRGEAGPVTFEGHQGHLP